MPPGDEHSHEAAPVLSYRLPAAAHDVTVATYPDELAARLAMWALLGREIGAHVHRAGQFEVRVPEHQEHDARRVLDEVRARAERLNRSRRCPACDLEGVAARSPVRRTVGAMLVIVGIVTMLAAPPVAVVLIAVGVGAFAFAVRGEVLRCPRCRRTIHPIYDDTSAIEPAGGSDA